MAGEITQAPNDICEIFNNADLTFPSIKNSEGEEVAVTHGTYISHVESKDRRVRKDAFDSLYSVYYQFLNTSASILDSQIGQLLFRTKERNYETTLHAALARTEVPVEVYSNLIQTVHEIWNICTAMYACVRKC